MIKKTLYKEWVIISFFIILYIAIRSIYFSHFLNFSQDQASQSIEAFKLWTNKEITLIGPSISFKYIGREVFNSSIIYYYQLIFLLIGNFNPAISSYIFTVFSSIFLIPLYFGTKLLINKNSAILMLVFYSLFPVFVDYTRFFWNPNFQLTLTPILIFLLGLYSKRQKDTYLFFISFTAGFLTLFHYQYILIFFGLIGYFFRQKENRLKKILIFLFGFIIGFSPILIFELRNNFYNFQTLILYLQNLNKISINKIVRFPIHYFLSIFLFLFILLISKARKNVSSRVILGSLFLLLILDSFLYLKKPNHAFGMANNWNYLYEEKVYKIIKDQKLKDFNIVNLGYDTKAVVQKYLFTKDDYKFNFEDYYKNKYLFLITNKNNYMDVGLYEVNTFKPSQIIRVWQINKHFKMYLLERINK